MNSGKEIVPNDRWKKIIPPTILVYVVAFLDRTNIGFAIAGGMDKDLMMAPSVAGFAAGIFFIGYLILQVPGGILAERKSAKKFVAWTILAWGGLTLISGFSQNVIQFMIIRFLIGVAEGGIWPAILIIISHWFPMEERGRANALFMMNAPIASIIAGPLSGIILTFFSWRYLFFIEGLISLLLIAIWLPLVNDHPKDARWISKEEREYIESKLQSEQKELKDNYSDNKQSFRILLNLDLWKLIGIYFLYQTGIYGFVIWLPKILKTLTHSGIFMTGVLTAIPYVATLFGLYFFAKKSDKTMNRKLYTAIPILGFAVSLFLSMQFRNEVWLSYSFFIICGFFLLSGNGVFWTIPTLLFPKKMAAASLGIINIAGGLGGFLGPFLVGYLTDHYDSYIGIYSLVFLLMGGFFLIMGLPSKTGRLNLQLFKT